MRLTCPNCGARYEVDDSLIPPEGRDVQCSNCASTWFQPGRRVEAQPEPEAGPATAPQAEPGNPPAPPADAATQPVADEAPAAAPAPPSTSPEAATASVRPRRPINPGVRDILREEAEREARLRRGQPDLVESQAEMPLDQPSDSAARARRRAERAQTLENAQEAFDVPPAEAGSHAEGARRDLLPDIEEINSTLRATGDRVASEADASDVDTVDTALRRRQGVRLGFGFVVLAGAVIAWAYINHDTIIGWLPSAEPLVEDFVTLLDGARFWLDGLAQRLIGDDAPL